jgi:hypothetical protein
MDQNNGELCKFTEPIEAGYQVRDVEELGGCSQQMLTKFLDGLG